MRSFPPPFKEIITGTPNTRWRKGRDSNPLPPSVLDVAQPYELPFRMCGPAVLPPGPLFSCTGRSESNGPSGGHCSEQQLQAIPVRRAYLKKVMRKRHPGPGKLCSAHITSKKNLADAVIDKVLTQMFLQRSAV